MFEKPTKYKQLVIKNCDGSQVNHIDFLTDIFTDIPHLHEKSQSRFNLFIKMCLDSGGFIAGGFAERICAIVLSYNIKTARNGEIASYVMGYKGDIDTWFPTPKAAQDFEKNLLATQEFIVEERFFSAPEFKNARWAQSFVHAQTPVPVLNPTLPTPPGAAPFQFTRSRTDNYFHYQVITRVHGSPEQVLSDFDIYNAKCYITKEGIFMPEHFEHLLHRSEMHALKMDYKTFKRLVKWRSKRLSYTKLTPQTVNMISQIMETMIDDCLNKKLRYFGKFVTPPKFAALFLDRLFSLKPEYLVLLSQFANSSYDYDIGANIKSALQLCSNS